MDYKQLSNLDINNEIYNIVDDEAVHTEHIKESEGQGSIVVGDVTTNIAYGNNSTAMGIETIAGCKGYYISAIDPTNFCFYLSDSLVPIIPSWDNPESFYIDNFNSSYEINPADEIYKKEFSISSNGYYHWVFAGEVKEIVGNKVIYSSTWLNNNEKWLSNVNNGADPAIFFIPAQYSIGIIPIGLGSHAEGYYTLAAAEHSHTEGWGTLAAGRYGHAEGNSTRAGFGAHAEGVSTLAYGLHSHSEGNKTSALGSGAHAEGDNTTASGNYSHTEGLGTKTSADCAHAEGWNTTASGSYSHAEGCNTISSGSRTHAEGQSTEASGNYSHSEGNSTKATADCAHAEGWNTVASGTYSHTEGQGTIASSSHAHAEGLGTIANGTYSHAEGAYTKAIAECSHAEGLNTTANGTYSHAEGYATIASGSRAHAEGWGTIASGAWQHVDGKWNEEDPEVDAANKKYGKYAHIVGNGTGENEYNDDGVLIIKKRSNAHTLDWNGNAWYAGTGTFTDVILEDATNGNVNVKSTLTSHGTRLSILEQTAAGQGGLSLVVQAVNEDFASHSLSEIYACAKSGGTVVFDDFGRIYTLSWAGDTEEAVFNYIDNEAAYVYYITINENKLITRFSKELSTSGDINLDSIIGTETDEPTANTIYGAKNYTDEEISKLHILSEETITTIATQEAEKVKTELLGGEDLNETYDTIKEISDWLSDDITGAAKIINDIDTLQKEQVGKKLENNAVVINNNNNIAVGGYSTVHGYNFKTNILIEYPNLVFYNDCFISDQLILWSTYNDNNTKQFIRLARSLQNINNFEIIISNEIEQFAVVAEQIYDDGGMAAISLSKDLDISIIDKINGNNFKITHIYKYCGAYGHSSHISGSNNIAQGASATVEGNFNEVAAHCAHAEGHDTFARGYASHASGRNTEARGHSSFTSGHGTFAAGAQQFVFGTYNEIDTKDVEGQQLEPEWLDAEGLPKYQYLGDKDNYIERKGKYVQIVGNGADENTRSNAYTLDWKGNAWYQGTVESAGIILTSPSGFKFKLSVDDTGNLTTVKL